MLAMKLYSGDFADALPPNPDDGNTTPGYNWCPGVVKIGGAQQFNPDILDDPTRSMLVPSGANHSQFKCPADKRIGLYSGTKPDLKGKKIPAARTLAMNQAVGTDPYAPSYGKLPVNGPWLNNNGDHTRGRKWYVYGKLSDFVYPGPAKTFVLVDEDDRSLNDAAFGLGMERAEWIDWPGTYHNNACGFSFADGHSEVHKWVDPRTKMRGNRVLRVPVPGSIDWTWISDRTSALIVK